jgi:quercetin dioxygenase-like cupin family protein
MHLARVAGLLLVSIATLAQQQSVEITSEPSHHLVMENTYVRVFDVTVAPKATTLVHRHNHDYVFVTLGDSDVISARPGEKPAALLLKDGEIRFTRGKFAHAAINQSDIPFHNITIELLKPATNVKSCVKCSSTEMEITSDQWTMSVLAVPQAGGLQLEDQKSDALLVAISNLELSQLLNGNPKLTELAPGKLVWLPAGVRPILKNKTTKPAMFAVLKFNPEKQ